MHLLPVLGNKELDIIKCTDIFALQQKWIHDGKAPGTINKYLVLLRYIFNLALKWEVPGLTINPTKNLALLQVDNKRQRFLTSDEAQSLIHAVRNSENIVLEPIVSMLLITGARKREVLDARWEYIDWQRRLWKIPKTKADKAVSKLQAIAATSSLIPKLINLLALFTTRGIQPASRQAKMTQPYAHLAHETLLEACNVAGGLIRRLNNQISITGAHSSPSGLSGTI